MSLLPDAEHQCRHRASRREALQHKSGLWPALQQADFCRTRRTMMPRASVTPFQALQYSLLIKQMSCFRTGFTSGQIKNSRKAILWFYTGFRKGGKVFPIPLATVLKSDCMTLKTKQDNVMSMELLFARQLIPPEANSRTAGKTARSSSDLKKLHYLFHWTRAFCSFLQTSPSSLLLSTSTSRRWQAAVLSQPR